MAERRKSGPITHLVSIAAASVAVLAFVGTLPTATRPAIVATATAEPAPPVSLPLRPSYIVRAAPPVVAAPEAGPIEASLSVRTVAPLAEPEPEVEKWYVTAEALNLRVGPSSASEQLTALPMGTAVEISGAEGKWTEVSTADGLRGWVFTKYLSRTAPPQ